MPRTTLAALIAVALIIAISPASAKTKYHKVASVLQASSCGMDRGVSLCPGEGYQQAPRGRRQATVAVRGYDVASGGSFLPHPPGCPRTQFCACGVAVELFGGNGRDWRNLWQARAWYKFPRSHSPSSGDVAVRNHHVFVLASHIEGDVWMIKDFNSGNHQSRLHARSINGYTIVSPSRSHVAQLN